MKNGRFYEIDLLRFLAALSVLLFHYTFRGAVGGAFTDVSFPELAGATKYGYLGVNLFFLISGFVILMTASGKSARQFVVSRAARLYPAFWCCVTLTFLATLLLGQGRFAVTAGQYLVNLTMLHEPLHVESVDGVYWSLLVELKFYALVFLLVLFGQVRHVKVYLGAWLAAALWLSVHHHRALGGLLIPEYAGYFIAGATFFLIAREGNSAYKTVLLVASYLLTARYALGSQPDYLREHGVHFNPWVDVAAVAAFFVLLYLIATGKTRRFGSSRFVWLGALTYPLYLLHQNLGYMLFNLLGGRVEKHVLLAGVTALILAASWWVHRQIESTYGPRLRALLERALTLAGGLSARLRPGRRWVAKMLLRG